MTLGFDIARLPRPKQGRHRWGTSDAFVGDTPSGCQETRRVCALCGLVKITVHQPHGLPYRLWQYPDGERAAGLTPMCEAGPA